MNALNILKKIIVFEDNNHLAKFMDHSELEICIPSGFYKFNIASDCGDTRITTMKIKCLYLDDLLNTVVNIVDEYLIDLHAIVPIDVSENKIVLTSDKQEAPLAYSFEYPIYLSIQESKELISLLLNHFECFSTSIKTISLKDESSI